MCLFVDSRIISEKGCECVFLILSFYCFENVVGLCLVLTFLLAFDFWLLYMLLMCFLALMASTSVLWFELVFDRYFKSNPVRHQLIPHTKCCKHHHFLLRTFQKQASTKAFETQFPELNFSLQRAANRIRLTIPKMRSAAGTSEFVRIYHTTFLANTTKLTIPSLRSAANAFRTII